VKTVGIAGGPEFAALPSRWTSVKFLGSRMGTAGGGMEQIYECVGMQKTRERDGERGWGAESGLTGEGAGEGYWGAVGEARDG